MNFTYPLQNLILTYTNDLVVYELKKLIFIYNKLQINNYL